VVVGGHELRDAVVGVHARPAEAGRVDVLAHDVPDHRRTGEEQRVAGERGDAVVHARASRGDEADHRSGGALGQLHHPHDRVGVRLAERAAGEALVLRVAVDGPARDRTGGADHAVARLHPLRLPARQHRRADHVQRAGIAEGLEPRVRVQRSRLRGDRRAAPGGGAFSESAHWASRQSTALWPPNPNAFEMPIARPFPPARGRASFGT
jgi:hypothetical protein